AGSHLPSPPPGAEGETFRECAAGRCRSMHRRTARWIAGCAVAILLSVTGCTVGPDYDRPAAPVPAAYKEAAAKAGWQVAQPSDALDRGAWWSVYKDPVLDGLEHQVDISNQNLKAAEATFRQAEAIVAQARFGFLPTASINAQAQRSRRSGNLGRGPGGPGSIQNFFSVSETASWVPDLCGRVARNVVGDFANAHASAGDLA